MIVSSAIKQQKRAWFSAACDLPLSWRKGKAGLGDLFYSMLTVAH
jgi:hypothetical protein